MKTLLAAIATLFLAGVTTAANAGDSFELSPSACEDAVAGYMETRLSNPRAAKVHLTGEPYKVMVAMRGGAEVKAWAVDVRVKSKLPSGSWSNFQPYTVIFQNGSAVALEDDLPRVTRA